MLHALNASNGEEEWAFVPPLLAASFPSMVNVNLNRSVGGSNAIYGVDGSLVAQICISKVHLTALNSGILF